MDRLSLTGYMTIGMETVKASDEGRLFIIDRQISLDTHMQIIDAIKQIVGYVEVSTDCQNMV